jgi:hypothetical protein
MKPLIIVLVGTFLFGAASFAQISDVTLVDSIKIGGGDWLTADIRSHDTKAVYLSDGRAVMYRVIIEIRTRRESLIAELQEQVPGCVAVERDGCWSLQFNGTFTPAGETGSGRFFAGMSAFANVTSTKAGAVEALLHLDVGFARWLFVELGGSYGQASSDGPRQVVLPAAAYRSTIEYEGFLLAVGVGVQYRIGSGRLEFVGNIGNRSLSSSFASGGQRTGSFAQITKEVAFLTSRYVHAFAGSSVSLSAGVRYFLSNVSIDSEVQRFGFVAGVGFRL